ncbi:hypothetical protein [Streptomyces sp. NPDC055287]
MSTLEEWVTGGGVPTAAALLVGRSFPTVFPVLLPTWAPLCFPPVSRPVPHL